MFQLITAILFLILIDPTYNRVFDAKDWTKMPNLKFAQKLLKAYFSMAD